MSPHVAVGIYLVVVAIVLALFAKPIGAWCDRRGGPRGPRL